MSDQLAGELAALTQQQRRSLYRSVFAIELTSGCSIGCDFCGYSVPRGVRDHINFGVLEYVSGEMGELNGESCCRATLDLYDESEPLDYEDGGKHYFDARELFSSMGIVVFTSTAVPEGKEELAAENVEKIDRISISHMNRERLMPFFGRLGIAVCIDVPGYYDSKLGRYADGPAHTVHKVSGSVEEALAALRREDPSLPEKAMFYDMRTHNRGNFYEQHPDTLAMWCEAEVDRPGSPKVIDKDYGGVNKFGRAFRMPPGSEAGWNTKRSFCDISGAKLTPDGVFHVRPVPACENNKTGRVTEKVLPEQLLLPSYL